MTTRTTTRAIVASSITRPRVGNRRQTPEGTARLASGQLVGCGQHRGDSCCGQTCRLVAVAMHKCRPVALVMRAGPWQWIRPTLQANGTLLWPALQANDNWYGQHCRPLRDQPPTHVLQLCQHPEQQFQQPIKQMAGHGVGADGMGEGADRDGHCRGGGFSDCYFLVLHLVHQEDGFPGWRYDVFVLLFCWGGCYEAIWRYVKILAEILHPKSSTSLSNVDNNLTRPTHKVVSERKMYTTNGRSNYRESPPMY